ncbi:MAG TPA: DUF2310 family Zn-ribbon-containing protein [Blastocatellia bacterium]
MFIVEVTFTKTNQEIPDEGIAHVIYGLLATWHSNGQIVSDEWRFVGDGESFTCILTLPEADSLEAQPDDSLVNKSHEYLHEKGLGEPSVRVIGRDAFAEENICDCSQPAFYIVYTHVLSQGIPPLRCGKCFGYVPVYRVPGSDGILGWKSDYQAFDGLQLGNEPTNREQRKVEGFALQQMQRLDSALTIAGREICQKIEQTTKIPTYYYLHVMYEVDEYPHCPSCGNNWTLNKTPLHLFSYCCDRCRLLSSTSSLWRRPRVKRAK